MRTTELQGIGILVTRPGHQAELLCELIERRGGRPWRFPVLSIEGPADPAHIESVIARLSGYDIAVFVSPNAVQWGVDFIEAGGGLPAGLQLGVVGRGSARALEAHTGRRPDLCPVERYDSEALLALPELQHVAGRRIIVFRGNGGRELIAETLRRRGAHVEYAEVYRRGLPQLDPGPLLAAWGRNEVDMVTVTSSEGLHNLIGLLGAAGLSRLQDTPLVVVSQRTADLARSLGFTRQPVIVSGASDQALVETVVQWASHRELHSSEPSRHEQKPSQ